MAAIRPPSRIRMRSASCTEDSRCAIMIFVVVGMNFLNPMRISASVLVSTALVESSRIRIFGFLSSARAMQRRCFCPPETFVPPCSICVSYPSGNCVMNSSACARRHASSSSASVASGLPQRRFSLMVPENSTFFCKTTATWLRSTSRSYFRTSSPPTRTAPEVTS